MIPAGERGQIAGADVVVLPFGYKDCEQAFTTSVYDFLAYARERSLFKIEVCCPEEGFTELELCSAKKRLGKFLLASTITGTIWGGCCIRLYLRPGKAYTASVFTHRKCKNTPVS